MTIQDHGGIITDDGERFWYMDRDDPTENRPWGIVDEEAGGIIAYALSEDHAQFIVYALNNLEVE